MNYNALQPTATICQRKFRNLRKKPQKRVEWKEENERKKKRIEKRRKEHETRNE